MRLAIASGKGGTGKTTLAVNLARSVPPPVQLLDCDVEEPNAYLFLRPEIRGRESVGVPVPVVDESACDACGACGAFCEYHAIVSLRTKPLIFPELCHGCGGCAKVCPAGAIAEVEREIGVVETGGCDGIAFVQGRLNVGEAMAPPLIRAVKRRVDPSVLSIIDCPPGTSCPVIVTLRDCDYAILVTEPTPFGLHDLTLAAAAVRELGLPFGIVINRADAGDDRVVRYARAEGIPVLLEIPDDRAIAEAYARGELAVDVRPHLREDLAGLLRTIVDTLGVHCEPKGRGSDADL
ncbi:MAG: ATP-binding protein [Planctomycetes bacterium]|nr:ATP-binding protein [Planctomycetota bacterium]